MRWNALSTSTTALLVAAESYVLLAEGPESANSIYRFIQAGDWFDCLVGILAVAAAFLGRRERRTLTAMAASVAILLFAAVVAIQLQDPAFQNSLFRNLLTYFELRGDAVRFYVRHAEYARALFWLCGYFLVPALGAFALFSVAEELAATRRQDRSD